jgi:acetyl-CoA carboxylase biotin carboxyl carrier protein
LTEIDLEAMEKLIAMMKDNELAEVHYRDGEFEIDLKRGGAASDAAAPVPTNNNPTLPTASAAGEPEVADENAGLLKITSPMVGTFYATPDPESPPFVKVGSTVQKNTTVCIIEAMKVFNEIESEVEGTIEKVVAGNAQAVEYGETLFYVRPR